MMAQVKRYAKELRYGLYLTVHPFKGFWDIKHEKEGSLGTAAIILAATIIVRIASTLFSGYLFVGKADSSYNMIYTIISSLFLYFDWCVANWALTCLSDGKGSFRDIMMFTAYSLIPFAILQTIMIFCSNIFILREQTFYNMMNGFSYVWTGFLMLTGMLTTHEYTLTKTIVVVAATILGMVVIAVLIVMFFTMFQEVISFISIVADELVMRMSL